MKALVPKGHKLIALSELPGTGGVIGKAYYNPERKTVFFVIIDPVTDSEFPFGPMETRVLKTMDNVVKDIIEMGDKPVHYIEE